MAEPPDSWEHVFVPRGEATILHADLDAFFASVEQRDDPRLRGRPMVVGRGVVLAASYEARAFGIRGAMGGAQARSLCPWLVAVDPRMEAYTDASRAVFDVFSRTTPIVEGISIDEAFLDVGGLRRVSGEPVEIARDVRHRVRDEVGLPITVGVASSKFLAKVASAVAKPDGLLHVPVGEELAFLHPLPVKALWGVGPATLARLERYGVRTVGDLAELPRATLESAVGRSHGGHLHDLAHGIDPRSVDPDQELKSISHEETYPTDRFDPEELRREAIRMADAVAARLRRHGSVARTVTLKVRFGDDAVVPATLAGPDGVRVRRRGDQQWGPDQQG